jgi:hypothetical protein
MVRPILLAIVIFAWSLPATAELLMRSVVTQMVCGDSEDMGRFLAGSGAFIVGYGKGHDADVSVAVWQLKDGQFIVTSLDESGAGCIIQAGSDWKSSLVKLGPDTDVKL